MIPKNLIWSGQPDSNWSSLAWKAKVQPLYHTRYKNIRRFVRCIKYTSKHDVCVVLAGIVGLEPTTHSHLLCRLSYMPICLVEGVGFEPTMFTFRNRFTVCRNTTVVAVLPCMVLKVRIELTTHRLQNDCSTY